MGAGEAVRGVTRAGVLARLGRALGVEGLARAEEARGEGAGLGEAVLPRGGVAGDAARRDRGLGLRSRDRRGGGGRLGRGGRRRKEKNIRRQWVNDSDCFQQH